jgi:TP901 family phage tail tape measure protein
MVGISSGAIEAGKAFVKLAIKDETKQGLQAVQRNLTRFSARMATFSRRMAVTAGMIGAPIVAALRSFAAFEKQMAEVSTMLDKPQQHMKRFSTEIQRMSMQFGQSTGTLAKGLYQILSATIDASKALGVLHASAKAAIAGLSDTTTAADLITTVLNSYNMEANDATKISDILFATIKRGKTTFAELAQFLGKLTAVSAEVGVKFEEVTATIALLTRNGVQTEVAVTAIRQALASLLKPAKQSADEFERIFGMAMSPEAIEQMGGLPGFLKRLSERSGKEIAKMFPNVRALMGVLPAASNNAELQQDVKAMQDSAGATEEAYEKMSKTLSFQLDRLKKSFIVFLQVVGKQFMPEVKDLGDLFQAAAAGAVAWINKQKPLIMGIGKLVLGMIALSAAAFLVAKGIALVMAAMAALVILSKVTLAIFMALVSYPLVMLQGIGLVIAGINSAGKRWQDFENYTVELWDNMKINAHKAMLGVATALKTGNLDLAMEILIAGLEVLWEDFWFFVKEGFNSMFSQILIPARKAGAGIAKALNSIDKWIWEKSGKKVDPPFMGGGDPNNKRWFQWMVDFQEKNPERFAELSARAREQAEGMFASGLDATGLMRRQDFEKSALNKMLWEEARTQYGKATMGLKEKEYNDMAKGLETLSEQFDDPAFLADEGRRIRREHNLKMERLQEKLDARISEAKSEQARIEEQYAADRAKYLDEMKEGMKPENTVDDMSDMLDTGMDDGSRTKGLLRGLTGAFNTVAAMRVAMSAMLPPVVGVDERNANANERSADILQKIDRKLAGVGLTE